MKLFIYIFSLVVFPLNFYSQSSFYQFKKLSSPEKKWVLFHPFIAKKAFRITKEVLMETDSIKKIGIIGTDNNGGLLDAFKHTYWMAALAKEIGSKKALKLGKAHEKGNYFQYKKHSFEDNILPDSISSAMDLKNNEIGVAWGHNCKNRSRAEIQKIVLGALSEGKLRIIKKDEQGNFLTCDGLVIPMEEWIGKWNIPKCLEYSFKH